MNRRKGRIILHWKADGWRALILPESAGSVAGNYSKWGSEHVKLHLKKQHYYWIDELIHWLIGRVAIARDQSRSIHGAMPYNLEGRNVLITGASRYLITLYWYTLCRLIQWRVCRGIWSWSWRRTAKISRGLGALIADKFAAQGCNLAINYNASQDRARQVAKKIQTEYKSKPILIQGVWFPIPHSLSGKSLTEWSGRGKACRMRENCTRSSGWIGGSGCHHLKCSKFLYLYRQTLSLERATSYLTLSWPHLICKGLDQIYQFWGPRCSHWSWVG